MQPRQFVGIDYDERMRHEEVTSGVAELRWGDMTSIRAENASFDVAFCLSVFEHLDVSTFRRAVVEIHRVLKPGGSLVVTLDQRWDRAGADIPWNELERSVGPVRGPVSFGLPELASLMAPLFSPRGGPIPVREDRDRRLVHDRAWNSCVAYGLFDRRDEEIHSTVLATPGPVST